MGGFLLIANLLVAAGKGLAAFLKAIGYIIPLMDTEYANYYTREVCCCLVDLSTFWPRHFAIALGVVEVYGTAVCFLLCILWNCQ